MFDIILDHGSTVNICSHQAAFSRMDNCKLELQWFNGNKVHVDKGTASYMLYDHLNKRKVQFTADMMLNPSGVLILSHARLVRTTGSRVHCPRINRHSGTATSRCSSSSSWVPTSYTT